MEGLTDILRSDERAVLALRRLYESRGYKRYKMSKFENYDLYLENKSFLASEKIVTFTDPGGKLLALKPDITLSIIKNAPRSGSGLYKVYYSENVYRAGADSEEIKEITQVGTEIIGSLDMYSEAEALILAARSLKAVSDDCIISVSHMGLISAMLDEAGLEGADRERVSQCIAQKNAHTIREICTDKAEPLCRLSKLYGSFETALPQLFEICGEKSIVPAKELEGLCGVISAVGEQNAFVLDFTVTNDMDYYNGVTFQGFINGISRHVLSGGRYDALISRMGLSGGAIGFAVYPDALERLYEDSEKPLDVALVYNKDEDAAAIAKRLDTIVAEGKTVCAAAAGTDIPAALETVYMRGAENE